MSIYRESGFSFDFPSSLSFAHDKAELGDGNTFWPGVDFRVIEDDQEVWIEVKSWSHQTIRNTAERRLARKDWDAKIEADDFRDAIVAKFLGTTAYLAWSQIGLPPRVRFIVFLEPPHRSSRGMIGPFRDRLRDEFKNAQARAWGSRLRFEVVDLDLFRARFPNYKVERLPRPLD